MDENERSRYARKFGLPAGQVRLFDELTAHEKEDVRMAYSLYNARKYVYAVKRAGGIVLRRFRADT